MQRKILFIGVRPEEVRNIFTESLEASNVILSRSNIEEALHDLSNGSEVHSILIKPDYLRHLTSKNDAFEKSSRLLSTNAEFPELVGISGGIREVCRRIGQVAVTDSTVLIEGQSGTGKELVAKAIHFHSRRAHKPFIKVNCAALPDTLIESELFGHVRGAFTGAIQDRKGRFAQANGGTILLDEIGSMPLTSQTKFLRVLQEKEFEPVGSSTTVKIDVRVLATDNSDLAKGGPGRTFREDLYYRLSVFPIVVPQLRERKKDIPLLAEHFLHKYVLMNRKISSISPEALRVMVNYHWPGNVRELENAIQHALIVETMNTIQRSSLPIQLSTPAPQTNPEIQSLHLREKLNLYESQLIHEALTQSRGKKMKAAQLLGINPKNFSYLLHKHNLTKKS